ncbi:MAG: GWxTD domain-containing protein [Candidatus Aminicenantes bacterium]|nr:GWxTD domain-containing protein [Candidatus Aminicenantes bacterium]
MLPVAGALGQAKRSVKDLSPYYQKWLQEDVVYIITPKEKEVFLQLENDRQREMFIEAFWKQRDPNPTTPENEFKVEHERRIAYANQTFGKSSPGPGWRSDQGRIYIILGEPNSKDRFENQSEVYPVEIWFYSGRVEDGLPNGFYVVFFKKDGIGEYELYTPIKYGPQYLMPNYSGDMTDYAAAYGKLVKIEPTIAYISLSLIEGESLTQVAPSIASEALIHQRVPNAPRHRVKDTYADKLLSYKDIIDVEYSANYIDSGAVVRVLQSASGLYHVHYLIEPSRLTFEQFDRRFLTNLEVNGSLTDASGRPVYQFERKTPVELNRDQITAIRPKPFSFQDMLPLIAGRYKLSLLWKNTVSKEFTSLEADVVVPGRGELRMTPILLANRADTDSKYAGQNKPFLMGRTQLVPSTRNDFARNETLSAFVQIQGLTDELRAAGRLEFVLLRGETAVRTTTRRLSELPDPRNVLEQIPLADLTPADYDLEVTLYDGAGTKRLSDRTIFYLSFMPDLVRPWTLALTLPPDNDPANLHALGLQYRNVKDFEQARRYLEAAFRRNPAEPEYALDFARFLFDAEDYLQVKPIALSFVRDRQRYEFLEILGQSSQALGELAEAIEVYKEYLERLGTNLNVLNSIGDCYRRLGNAAEALVAYEKSLEINADQPAIRAAVKELKERK